MPRTPKVAAPKTIRLRKAAKPKGDPKTIPLYRMRYGTPEQMDVVDGTKSTERKFVTESAAKEAAITVFANYKPFMERVNKAGLGEIEIAIGEIQSLPSLLIYERRAVERTIDSYSGLRIRVELWKVKP